MHHFTFLSTMYESSDFSTSSLTTFYCVFDDSHPSWWEVVSHCGWFAFLQWLMMWWCWTSFQVLLWRNVKTLCLFFKLIFRERGMEWQRKVDKHQCVVASHVPPRGDLACNPDMCPDWELDWRPFALQACTQSTELHQPGHASFF